MSRGLLIIAFSILLTNSVLARTWPTQNFNKDPGANKNHIFGKFKPAEGYREPDFNYALQLTSPLHDQKFETYDIIVLINIANTKDGNDLVIKGQKVRVYVRDNVIHTIGEDKFTETKYDPVTGLLYYWNISTARQGHVTPRGYFRPESFSSAHESSLYNNALMPWTVFFYGNVGTHGVLGEKISHLGTPASAGCVRMEPQRAKDLFHLIGLRGKDWVDKIDRTGNFEYTADGKIIQEINYKTLISVR